MVADAYEKDPGFQTDPQSNEKHKPALWVYDLESKLEYKQVGFFVLNEFKIDSSMCYEKVELYEASTNQLGYHVADLVTAHNPLTGQQVTFKGDTCLEEFCSFLLNYNKGDNIVLAHNASGYDTALIHEAISRSAKDYRQQLIVQGTKFMQLKIAAGKRDGRSTRFQDSMLHVMGSVKKLIQEYAPDSLLRKGFWPHLFNTKANAGKIYPDGPPELKYYDLAFGGKSKKDVDEHVKWLAENKGKPWDFDKEYLAYNIEDVMCLSKIVKTHNDILYEKFGHCPWKKITSASYTHLISLIEVTKMMELPPIKDPMRANAIIEASKTNWVKLHEQEYAMVKAAFRGGRTEARRLSFEITQEQYDNGDRIGFFDVVSLYPYVQISQRYPVGAPKIYVFDSEYGPCRKHKYSIKLCTECDEQFRFSPVSSKEFNYDVTWVHEQWDESRFLDEDFGGVIYATVIAPNMLHPILPLSCTEGEYEGKLIFPCGQFTSAFMAPEFKLALENGYKIVRVHCVHQYKLCDTKWSILRMLFLGKMVNGGEAPPESEWEDMINYFEEHFEMGDMVRDSLVNNEWGDRPGLCKTYKILLNSMWGKHAENPIKDSLKVYDYANPKDRTEAEEMFLNIAQSNYDLKSAIALNEDRFIYKYEINGLEMAPNLAKTYLPAAAYVTCYGRIMLWTMMQKFGKDLLYNDTDSVFAYIRGNEPPKFIPSSYWGGWKEENESIKGIRKMICFAAKCYGLKMFDGSEKVKAKGLSLTYGVSKHINFAAMEQLMNKTLATGQDTSIQVPQKRFIRQMGKGIHTRNQLKIFNCSMLGFKGKVDETGYVYPPGYTGIDFVPHPFIK